MGYVVDSASLQLLEAFSVALKNEPGNQTTSDELGYFHLKIKSIYPALLTSYVGYRTTMIQPDSGWVLIKLKPDGLNLKDVTSQIDGRYDVAFPNYAKFL